MIDDFPKLRPVEAIPTSDEMICLRDLEGLADKMVLVAPPMLFLLALFDGKHSLLDIQAAYTRRFGDLLFSERLREVIEQLDRCLLLDSPRFRDARRQAVEAFRAAPVRAAAHAGQAYEGEAGALRAQLDGLLAAAGGAAEAAPAADGGPLRGLIAPHIDPRRGGAGYAHGYAELARGCRARTFLVLGISHLPTSRRFVLTAKDFSTPLGTLPADRGFVTGLAGRLRTDFFADEFAHRGEHSIEFQAIFLQHLFAGDPRLRIIPILCSSSGGPAGDAEAQEFLPALKEVVDERGEEICLIAGVDLSHVGRRFGQDLKLSPRLLQDLEAQDRALLGPVLERDAEGFFRRIQETGDATNVCGTPAIYALLRLLGPGGRGRLLHYGQAADESTQSVVSFAAAVFRE